VCADSFRVGRIKLRKLVERLQPIAELYASARVSQNRENVSRSS